MDHGGGAGLSQALVGVQDRSKVVFVSSSDVGQEVTENCTVFDGLGCPLCQIWECGVAGVAEEAEFAFRVHPGVHFLRVLGPLLVIALFTDGSVEYDIPATST